MISTTLPAERPANRRRAGPRGRWPAVGLALALHFAILALFLISNPPRDIGEGVGAGAMDVSIAGLSHGAAPSPTKSPSSAKIAPPAPAPTPSLPADAIKPRTVFQIVSDILTIPLAEHAATPTPLTAPPTPVIAQAMAQASGAPGAACDIGDAVRLALTSDPATHAAVLLIPRDQRVAANAVLLWNGAWTDPADVGGAPTFTVIRSSIRQIVASAQPACRAQDIVGPRFMLVPEPDGMVVIAVGNATWRWSDLLVDPDGKAARGSPN